MKLSAEGCVGAGEWFCPKTGKVPPLLPFRFLVQCHPSLVGVCLTNGLSYWRWAVWDAGRLQKGEKSCRKIWSCCFWERFCSRSWLVRTSQPSSSVQLSVRVCHAPLLHLETVQVKAVKAVRSARIVRVSLCPMAVTATRSNSPEFPIGRSYAVPRNKLVVFFAVCLQHGTWCSCIRTTAVAQQKTLQIGLNP